MAIELLDSDLSELTTIKVGGSGERIIRVTTESELASGRPLHPVQDAAGHITLHSGVDVIAGEERADVVGADGHQEV